MSFLSTHPSIHSFIGSTTAAKKHPTVLRAGLDTRHMEMNEARLTVCKQRQTPEMSSPSESKSCAREKPGVLSHNGEAHSSAQ